MKQLLARLKRIFWIKFVFDVFARFGKDNGGLLAAGLAFFLVLAFVPLLLVGIATLAFFVHSPQDAVQKIQDLLTTQILPGGAGQEVKYIIEKADVAKTVRQVMETKSLVGLVGALSLIWAAIQIFINGSVAMNAAWETTEKRNWVKLRLIALGLLVATGVLLVLSLAATAYGTWLSHHFAVSVLITILTEVGAVILGVGMYAVIYKVLPAASVTWKSALAGGVFSALAWEIAKKGLSVYLLRPNKSMYGEIADLFVFVLWLYYSMVILVLGAEVSSQYSM
nr:YihY/virulence factor BrkB family protein [Armatimonadota bacterium]